MQNERETLLDHVLRRVPFDGWTDATLQAGAQDAGMGRLDVARLFPHGIEECLAYFISSGDDKMAQAAKELPMAQMKLHEKIAALVMLRLSLHLTHREAVRRSLAFYALPHHAAAGMALLYRTVDAIWHAAGDHAIDFSYYTKRATLAGIYSTTLVVWVDDFSEGQVETRAFLDRRLRDILRFARFKARCREVFIPWVPGWMDPVSR